MKTISFLAPLLPFLFLPLPFLLLACSTPDYPKSDHFDGKRFFNPGREKEQKGFLDFLRWQITADRADWPKQVANLAQPKIAEKVLAGEVHVTFINHATFLLQFESLNVLTDPVFSKRASPVQWAGPKRVREPAVTVDRLPKIDLVVVSHNHYDHLDVGSLKDLSDLHGPRFLVPLGNKALLEKHGVKNVEEIDWWDVRRFKESALVTLVPAQHWSARGLFDRNRALWGGFYIEVSGLKIFFAGDTGYGPHFRTIVGKKGVPDVSLLPIGAYEPRWFMKEQHMNPDDAVLAHLDLETSLSIGTHYGTFQLTDEALLTPLQELKNALETRGVSPQKFLAPETGSTIIYRKN
jgi:L-ascorbate metabolism protein UlaG (beta-lactamase superfamily)